MLASVSLSLSFGPFLTPLCCCYPANRKSSDCPEQVVEFESLAECKEAVRKYVARLPSELVPLGAQLLALRIEEMMAADPTLQLSEKDRRLVMLCWLLLLPAAHQVVLKSLVHHWHQLATGGRQADSALSRLAPAAMELLWRKPLYKASASKRQLLRFCEALIAQPEAITAMAAVVETARQALVQRLEPERASWEGAWPLLPPHGKSEARNLDLDQHKFLLGLMGL